MPWPISFQLSGQTE